MAVDNMSFLDELDGLATLRPCSLEFLITSRHKQYLQSALGDSSMVHIDLQQQLVDADLTAYLSHRCDMGPRSDRCRGTKQEDIDLIVKKSEGLFLYAKLAMDLIEAPSLPNGTPYHYRLKSTLPIAVALAQIYICCGPLLQILENIVNSSDSVQRRMTIKCLQPIQSGSLLHESVGSIGPGSDSQDTSHYRNARLTDPLLSYAVGHWLNYATLCDSRAAEFLGMIEDFLSSHSLPFRRSLALQRDSHPPGLKLSPACFTLEHSAARLD